MTGPDIHKIGPFTVHAGVTTLCGRAMQLEHDDGTSFSSRVNYWGKTGIVRHKPFRLLTLDDRDITCPECLSIARKPVISKKREPLAKFLRRIGQTGRKSREKKTTRR